MRVYAAARFPNPIPISEAEAIEGVARRSLPFFPSVATTEAWHSEDRRIWLWTWTNSRPDRSLNLSSTGVLAVTGVAHYRGAEVDLAEVAAALGRGDHELLSALGGAFSIVRASSKSIQVWNTPARLEHVYWQEEGEVVVVSNRALTAHSVARSGREPEYSVSFVRAMVVTGYPSTEAAPFQGIEVLPPASMLSVDRNGVRVVTPTWDDHGADLEESTEELVQSLVESVSLARSNSVVESALTGGKDSRLIVALLRAAGIEFATFTGGLDQHPDMVVARRVAAELGLSHTVKRPGEEGRTENGVLLREVLSASLRQLWTSDGSHSVFETIGSTAGSFEDEGLVLGGQGGEVVRGGYAKKRSPSHQRALSILNSVVCRNSKFLRSRALHLAKGDLGSWWQGNVHAADPDAALWRYYVQFRSGRWAAAGWASATASRRVLWPFYDAQVVRAAGRAPLSDLISEQLMFRTLLAFEPGLARIPLAETRWNFESDGPRPDDHDGYVARTPVVAAGLRGSFDWRYVFSTGLADVMDVYVMEATRNPLLRGLLSEELIRSMVSDARGGRLDGQRAEGYFLWTLFSVGLLLSNEWTRSSHEKRTIEFPVPQIEGV